MTDVETLLPPGSTDFELAMEQATARIGAVPIPLRELRDADKTPSAFLPFLAWERSVDIWSRKWSDDEKRMATRRSLEMHRLKGTLPGVRAHLAFEGVTVEEAFTPPMRVFSGPSLTRAEREAWLETLPQVRVWRQNERGRIGSGAFLGGSKIAAFMGTRFFLPSTARDRLRRRARWVVGGQETEVRVFEFGIFFQVGLTGAMAQRVYSAAPMRARRFFQPSTAADRLVTIAPTSISAWRSVVSPRLEPVTAEPETVADKGRAGFSVLSGYRIARRFFLPSTADMRLYSRYAVATGAGAAVRSRSRSLQFMGVGRYGMPPHTAELKLRMRGHRKPFAAGVGIACARARFWLPHDPEQINRTLGALRASKRLSDQIDVDTQTSFRFIAGRLALAGDSIII